ncbi:hypothetical protein [Natrialba taiwanensis]|uniref:Uncharacterized protein n=1 Tax=Natrialba taiwanensis DSM 12281 TaxID=1230458 RepID=L9ZFK8_9EURY|nr:hypothetical protein [Natrialba taiwanensis]ELY84831.1 hypothetical protein C484_21828 [Natrialba taiwanensis DSM 12281]
MSPRRDAVLSNATDEQTSSAAPFSRRRALQAGIATLALPLAGCVSDLSDESAPEDGDGNGNRDEADTDGTDDGNQSAEENAAKERDDSVDTALSAVVETYLNAAVEEDTETMSEVSHRLNPLDPAALEEEGWEFSGGNGDDDPGEYETTVRSRDAATDAVFELEGSEFWFDRDELDDDLADERLALLEVSADDPSGGDPTVWVLATENGEWKYLFSGPADDAPDDPSEAFEEPIEDEANDVVEEINWEYDSPTSDVNQAAVVLTDSTEIDAERVRIESTIAGGQTGAYNNEEFGATWTGITLYLEVDPAGDQIVVTAIDGDKETVVHREQFEP